VVLVEVVEVEVVEVEVVVVVEQEPVDVIKPAELHKYQSVPLE
jgi:hypothetical protein